MREGSRAITFNVLTIFPGMFRGFVEETMMKRAVAAGIVDVNLVSIRDYATDKHHTTDDTPYGGGPGMVMKVEPMYRALQDLGGKRKKRRTVLLSARGKRFDQQVAEKYAKLEALTLVCGRYEGVDQRVADHLCDDELSIGPYVLSGGEVAAMVVIESVARLVPGFLGNPESLKEESFGLSATSRQRQAVEYPQYTKPAEFNGWKVPDVLLSGDHKEIARWRKQHSRKVGSSHSRQTHRQ